METTSYNRRKRRTFLRLGILWLLMMLLFGVAAYALYYPRTGKPVALLPVVEAVARNVAPHFVFNVYGVTEPMGVAASRDGVFFVSESGGQRQIVAFDRNGREIFRTNPPNTTPPMRLPGYVAVSPNGTLYVADQMAHEVQMYAPTGDYLGGIRSPFEYVYWAPVGVAVDKVGYIYVTDLTDKLQRVVIFDDKRRLVRYFGKQGTRPGEMNSPNAVAIGDDGKIYVSSTVGARIDVYDAEGNYLGPEDKGFIPSGLPKGVYVDDQRRLYTVDTTSSTISVYDLLVQPPKLLFTFGSSGTANGSFRFPTGITGDATGRIYVADRVNNRIQVWSY